MEFTKARFSSGLTTNTSRDRLLPDVVRQAKDRLHQRLRSVELSSGRRQTTPIVGSIWAGPKFPSKSDSCTSEECRLVGTSICSNSCASPSTHKVSKLGQETCFQTGTRDSSRNNQRRRPVLGRMPWCC